MLQKKSQNLTGFLSNTIQDKMNLNIKFRKLGLAPSHSEWINKILNGMTQDKSRIVIDIEHKLLDKNDHPILRIGNFIETRELILNMLHSEVKAFSHERLSQICNLVNDLKKLTFNVILAIVEWRD